MDCHRRACDCDSGCGRRKCRNISSAKLTFATPNTSTMVDALARQARQDIQEKGVSDQKREEAMTFIMETYPDFYADNETMERAVERAGMLPRRGLLRNWGWIWNRQ